MSNSSTPQWFPSSRQPPCGSLRTGVARSSPVHPSRSDNFEKAVGLAKFAEKRGALFGRIQLIRKQSSAGGEHFARLEINQATTIKKLLLVTSNPQLDQLFAALATT